MTDFNPGPFLELEEATPEGIFAAIDADHESRVETDTALSLADEPDPLAWEGGYGARLGEYTAVETTPEGARATICFDTEEALELALDAGPPHVREEYYAAKADSLDGPPPQTTNEWRLERDAREHMAKKNSAANYHHGTPALHCGVERRLLRRAGCRKTSRIATPLLVDAAAPMPGVVKGVHVCPPEAEAGFKRALEAAGCRVVPATALERKRLERHIGRKLPRYNGDGPAVA